MGEGERLNLIANHTEYLKIWNITCERTWNITFATTVNFSKNAAHSHILMNGFNKVWNSSCFSVFLWFIKDWQWQLDNFANKHRAIFTDFSGSAQTLRTSASRHHFFKGKQIQVFEGMNALSIFCLRFTFDFLNYFL